jgi:hypothetical protein
MTSGRAALLTAGVTYAVLAYDAGCTGYIGDADTGGNVGGSGGGATGGGADGGGGCPTPPPASTACVSALARRRVWTLSRLEFDNSVAAVFGDTSNAAQATFPPEYRANGFSSNPDGVVVNGNLASQIMNVAETIAANQAAKQVASLGCALSSSPSASPQDPCAVQYITGRGKAAFRRPPTTDEIDGLYSVYLTGFQNPYEGTDAPTSGIQLVIAAMIQSPAFLYRSELGDPNDTTSPTPALTQYEIATQIAYLATAAPPDAPLVSLADAGQLGDPGVIQAQFKRLIATQAGHQQLERFVIEWLGADSVMGLATSSGPLTSSVASDMLTESREFVEHVLFGGTSTLNELLTADYTFVNKDLATYYGIAPADDTANFNMVNVDPAQRLGLLSQGSFLTTSASSGVPLLHRGHIIRSQLLCQPLPSFASLGLAGFTPPQLPKPTPGQTTRDQLTQLIQPGSPCYTCHQYFMPIGFGLESFDANGLYRTTDNGGPVDPSGQITAPSSVDPATGTILTPACTSSPQGFSTFADLVKRLAADPAVSGCFDEQIMTFSSGRGDLGQDECDLRSAQASFAASGANVLTGFSDAVGSQGFIRRQRQ